MKHSTLSNWPERAVLSILTWPSQTTRLSLKWMIWSWLTHLLQRKPSSPFWNSWERKKGFHNISFPSRRSVERGDLRKAAEPQALPVSIQPSFKLLVLQGTQGVLCQLFSWSRNTQLTHSLRPSSMLLKPKSFLMIPTVVTSALLWAFTNLYPQLSTSVLQGSTQY